MMITIQAFAIGGASFLSNPSFARLGLIGLFINSLLSSVVPIPTELTASGLLLAGQSKTEVLTILVIGSIIGGFLAYYIGYGGISFLRRLSKKPNKKSEYRGASLFIWLGYTFHLSMDTNNWRLYTHYRRCYKV